MSYELNFINYRIYLVCKKKIDGKKKKWDRKKKRKENEKEKEKKLSLVWP